MNELSKIIVLVSLLYLLPLAVRFPQTALKNDSKHQVLGTVVVLGLTAVSLLALGVYLKLILS
jgi:nitric oxide reductase large subunit